VPKTFSLIIPTLNSAPRLRVLLDAANGQTQPPDEIIIMDSNSEDNTADLARSMGAKVIVIPREAFNHGATRSLGGQTGRGELLLYMTDDAVPASRDCFARLLYGFVDGDTAAIYGRQLPKQGASLISQHLRYFNYPPQSYGRTWADRARYGIRTAFLSNSFCAYRKADLERIGWFRNDIIAIEDACAAYEMLKRGRTIRYQAAACVFHSHDYSPFQEFQRYFDTGVMHACERAMMDDLGGAESEGFRYLRSALRFFGGRIRVYPGFFGRLVMKYAGYRLGKIHGRLPMWLKRRLSMNPSWWSKKRSASTRPGSPSRNGPS
jgi:rhamnosyltransferase